MRHHINTWTFLGALTAFCLGFSESQATVTPYVADPSGFSDYALIVDLSKGGNVGINHSTFKGNVGVVNGDLSSSNNDTIYGDASFTNASYRVNNSVTVTGDKSVDVSLATAASAAAVFSHTIAGFSATQTLSSDLSKNTTLTSTGDLNVISLTGNNINGVITLKGDSNDVFYINVTGNLNISGVSLDGVDAKNVYWNIIGGQNVNLNNGTYYGTFLAYNYNTSQATSLNINNSTIEGNIYAGSLNMNQVTLNGMSLTTALENEAMAPEASSVAAMSLFGLFLFGTSFKRLFARRRHVLAEPQAA